MKKIFESWNKFLKLEGAEDEITKEKIFGFYIPEWEYTILSPSPISGVNKTAQNPEPSVKPNGLWYGIGNQWLEWMWYEMPEWLDDINYVYILRANYDNILEIRTYEQLLEFTKKYYKETSWSRRPGEKIDWHAVSKDYAGIEIDPYQQKARFELMWYYPWDVASGCIWDPAGLDGVKLMGERKNPVEKDSERDEDEENLWADYYDEKDI